ncbi:MAG: hypothetical protein LUI14_00085 [Lachnospiraceae bacterium]|nr:hypothetical protein [Lachnospiraceae bacterium]
MNRKKVLAFLLSMTCAFSAVPCIAWADEAETEAVATEATETEATETEAAETDSAEAADYDSESSADVMTYEEFVAADLGTEVVVETYVQAVQERIDGTTTIYAQDEDGAYLIYQAECTYEVYETLKAGVQIKVTGIKSGLEEEASEEVEADEADTEATETEAAAVRITDATIEVEDGSYVAEALDVTDLLGTDELAEHQNEYVSFNGMTIETFDDGEIYHYGKDGSGEDGDDLYFNASYNGETYTFVVAAALCDNTSIVYNFVRLLAAGDVMDFSGFLCWDEDGAVPHISDMDFSE